MRSAAAELAGRAEAAASLAGKGSALVQLLEGLLPPLVARNGAGMAYEKRPLLGSRVLAMGACWCS
jgi:hypothetical protein